jgi:regulator of replication initiation timing
MADRFEMSGDFRGAIVNIKSTLTNVQQSVGQIRTEDASTKAELEDLIKQLSENLVKVPPEKSEQAEAVAASAQALVEQAKSEKPNKTLLQISGDGLKQAAQNLAEVMPAVVTIASQIVLSISKLTAAVR